jgi:hypothetical protein
MLIEQGIICYVSALHGSTSLVNFNQGDLIVGLVECRLDDPHQLALSKNKRFVLVCNSQTIEIYYTTESAKRDKIIFLDLVLIVNYDSLPLKLNSIDDFAFSNSDNNVFYAIGKKNQEFDDQIAPEEDDSF